MFSGTALYQACPRRQKGAEIASPFIVLIAVLVFWEWWVSGDQTRLFLFASPRRVFETALHELSGVGFFRDVLLTVTEVVSGLIGGMLLGLIFGMVLWVFPAVHRALKPLLSLIGAVPIIALAPMLIVFIGADLGAKIVLSGVGVFFLSLARTLESAEIAASSYARFAYVAGCSRQWIARVIVLPCAWRAVVESTETAMALAISGAFLAEFVSSEAGLGHYIARSATLYDTPRVLLGTITLAIVGLMLTSVARTPRRCRGLRWRS